MALVLETETGDAKYSLFGVIGSGGMATIHLGVQHGAHGFQRLVAIKRLLPALAHDPHFVAMLIDEARLAARVMHPNVIQPLDIVSKDQEAFLVLEYIEGESLSKLCERVWEAGESVPRKVGGAIVADTLYGLHAAHEAKGKGGRPLDIVHRDVSPQNILVGVDGRARIFDFGLAKAAVRAQLTSEGHVKGKLAYMAPEQLRGTVSRRTDVYAAGVVLWELLVGRHAFSNDAPITDIVGARIVRPGRFVRDLPQTVDEVVMNALKLDPDERWPTARDMAIAIESTLGRATPTEVADWVLRWGAASLSHKATVVADIEKLTGLSSARMPAAARASEAEIATAVVPAPASAPAAARAPASATSTATSTPTATATSIATSTATATTTGRAWIVVLLLALLALGAVGGYYAAAWLSMRP